MNEETLKKALAGINRYKRTSSARPATDKVPRNQRFEKARINGKKVEVPWGTYLIAVDNRDRKILTRCCAVPRYQRRFQRRLERLFAEHDFSIYSREQGAPRDCAIWSERER
jgi:hypothetical protein